MDMMYLTYRFDFDTIEEMYAYLDACNYEIDYLDSSINIKNVQDKETKEFVGQIEIISNGENDEKIYQWWEDNNKDVKDDSNKH